MRCQNCGNFINEFDSVCTYCSKTINSSKIAEKGTLQLVFSVLETLTCSTFGIIALILYFIQLKPALESKDSQKIKSSKKLINVLLVVGLVFIILLMIFPLAIMGGAGVSHLTEIEYEEMISKDENSAEMIAMYCRAWYENSLEDSSVNCVLTDKFIKYTDISDELDAYGGFFLKDINMPASYMNSTKAQGNYYIAIVGTKTNNKIVVAVGPDDFKDVPKKDHNFNDIFNTKLFNSNLKTNYDGKGSGIIYIDDYYGYNIKLDTSSR